MKSVIQRIDFITFNPERDLFKYTKKYSFEDLRPLFDKFPECFTIKNDQGFTLFQVYLSSKETDNLKGLMFHRHFNFHNIDLKFMAEEHLPFHFYHLKDLDILIKASSFLNLKVKDGKGRTILFYAVADMWTDCLIFLINKDFPLEDRDSHNRRAFDYKKGYFEKVMRTKFLRECDDFSP